MPDLSEPITWVYLLYILSFLALVLGSLSRLVGAQRWTPSDLLSALPYHDGQPQDPDVVFVSPEVPRSTLFAGKISVSELYRIGKLLSAYSTMNARNHASFDVSRLLTIILYGPLFAYAGTWLFSIKATVLQLAFIVPHTILIFLAWRFVPKPHVCTIVGTDGFAILTGRFAVRQKRVWDYSYVFFSFSTTRVHVVAAPNVDEGETTPCEVDEDANSCLPRPLGITQNDWGDVLVAVYDAYDEYIWSRTLLQLAHVQHVHSEFPSEGHEPSGIVNGIRFPVVNDKETVGDEDFFVPPPVLRNRLSKLRPLSTLIVGLHGLHVITPKEDNQFMSAEYDPHLGTDYPQNENHLEFLPDQINSIEMKDGKLIIVADDRTVRYPAGEVLDEDILVRLFQADIWTKGVTNLLETELRSDERQLREAGWTDSKHSPPFWKAIGAHRCAVWKAAELVESDFAKHPFFGEIMKETTGPYKSANFVQDVHPT